MPGIRNPIQLSQIAREIRRSTDRAKHEAEEAIRKAGEWAESARRSRDFSDLDTTNYVDLKIHFIGANGIPKMDVVGTADPYFVAKLDDKIKFVSTVKPNTLAPVWNEYWKVKNVPSNARLFVEVLDKDDGTITDDYVGAADTHIAPGAKELILHGDSPLRRDRGTLWLKIESVPATSSTPSRYPYTFDGPIRFSRHYSPTVGVLTNLNDARLYSTWKMFLCGVPLFLGDSVQHWNTNYKAAQKIFQGPAIVRSSIQAGHRMLYARTTRNGFGTINGSQDVMSILYGSGSSGNSGNTGTRRVKPAVYTYVIAIDDNSFRFSETGAAFFVDFASKHALHANCAEAVHYSGEFHPRPEGGWENFSDDIPDDQIKWELVIDNNSGTYSPDPMVLPDLKELFEYNFPWFKVHAWDYNDPRLAQSRDACRAYALSKRGVTQDELEPHAQSGEVTLSHNATVKANHPRHESSMSMDQEFPTPIGSSAYGEGRYYSS